MFYDLQMTLISTNRESDKDLQNTPTTVHIIFEDEYNIKMNKSKIKILFCSRNETDRPEKTGG